MTLDYQDPSRAAELDLVKLAYAFASGCKLLVLSNPNNPTGVVYTSDQIHQIAALAEDTAHSSWWISCTPGSCTRHFIHPPSHDRNCRRTLSHPAGPLENGVTQRVSGGGGCRRAPCHRQDGKVAGVGIIACPGYSQTVLRCWFAEPPGWLEHRIKEHQNIRDDLHARFEATNGVSIRRTEGGSYIFPQLPALRVPPAEFRNILRSDHGITVTPGSEFGPGHDRSIRLNFSQQRDNALAAASVICDLATELSE